jgi:hypothetical protein
MNLFNYLKTILFGRTFGDTIPSISPWYVNNTGKITQRVAGTTINITGLTNSEFLALDSNGNLISQAGGGATIKYLVAASNAPTATKAIADYVCTGTNDDVQINAAVVAAFNAGGAKVELSIGDFYVGSYVTPATNVWIEGQGNNTVIHNTQSSNSIFRHTDNTTGLNHFTLRNLKMICPENGGSAWYSRGGVTYTLLENVTSIMVTTTSGINGFPLFFDEYSTNEFNTFRGLYIEGFSHGYDMLGGGMNNSIVEECTFRNGNGQGTANTGASYCVYRNNIFYNVGNPISLEGTSFYNLIEGNIAYNSGYFKAGLPQTNGEVTTGTIFTNNRSYFSGGIQTQGYGILIKGNVMWRGSDDGIFACVSNSIIEGNSMYQNNYGNSYRSFGAFTSNKGGIHLVNSTGITTFDKNTITNNNIYGDHVAWTAPDSSSEQDATGGIAIDTSYTKTYLNNNRVTLYFGVGTNEVVDSGTGTVRIFTEQSTLSVATGGTGASTQVTNGIMYYNGTILTTAAGWTYDGTNVALTTGGLAIATTKSIYLNGVGDSNWRIGRNIGVSSVVATANSTQILTSSTANEGVVIGIAAGNSIAEFTSGITYIRGYVGIGTTGKQALFAVDGNIVVRGDAGGNSWANQNILFGGDGSGYALGIGSVNNSNVRATAAVTIFDNGKMSIGNTSSNARLTIGTSGSLAGTIYLAGATSGSAIIGVPAVAGTTTFNLPGSNGSSSNPLITDGAGNTSWGSITGTGAFVLANSPTLVTPVLGVATATSLNKVTITAPTTSATLTLVNGSTLALNGAFTTTFVATANTTATLPTGTITLADISSTQTLTNKSISGSTNTITNVSLTTGVTGILSIPNGGTGSSTQNFVDLSTAQTVAGNKGFTGSMGIGTSSISTVAKVNVDGNIILKGVSGGNSWSLQRLLFGGDGSGYRFDLGSINNSAIVNRPALHVHDNGQLSIPMRAVTNPVAALATGGTLTVGTALYYVITASDGSGETIQSTEVTATPTSGNQTINLTWTATQGAASYNVYRSTVTGVYTTPAKLVNVTTNSYSDTGGTAVSAGAPPTDWGAYSMHFASNGSGWYLGGNFGFGVQSPSARLHLGAGTASTNTSPLKFTSGTLLTTTEAGAVEFDGTHFYGTVGTTRYKLDQQLGLITTVSGLPSASTAGVGARGFVTDATTPTFGATVVGGGAVASPVYSDGTNWKVG